MNAADSMPVDLVPADAASAPGAAGVVERRMTLRYGFNETLGWRQFALEADRERIWSRLRDADTQVIRIFALSEHTPDPNVDWESFAAYVQAVLHVAAVPMITFVTLPGSREDGGAVRRFAGRCASVAARCIEQWSGAVVRDWAWAIGNKPNSEWANAGLTFDHYRSIYEEAAYAISQQVRPFADGCRPMIGGPGVDAFQPFWMEWVWRFVNEIDNSLIGFASWNRYGEWRERGAWGAPDDDRIFFPLVMSRTSEYRRCAQAIGRALEGRGILNICTELNAHAHHETHVSGPFNHTTFGAAYYGSALIQLMQGRADGELLWTGHDDGGPYGVVDAHGRPTPAYHAKRLCARHVSFGDPLEFPVGLDPALDIVVARGVDARRSAFIAHTGDGVARYDLSGLDGLSGCSTLLTLDGDGTNIVKAPFDGTVAFRGYGVAAITNRPDEGDVA